jgi:predicted cupin superfamily sugar epimerase
MNADDVARLLDLAPLPGEGGRFRRTFHDGRSSAIHFLLAADDASAMHRLDAPEVWHHYAGAPVLLLLLSDGPPGGVAREVMLGDDIAAGHRPQVVVPAGVWQGGLSMGPWSLVGTTMAPPWHEGGFELGDPDELMARWPEATATLRRIAGRSG